ncbi:MAG TPA: ClpXP protease specificity-enhancing factor [Pseudomonadales bacterium]|nr:ClpXP protease specificity-enhancing factor [Pseudomonadales bacterium]
MLPSRPYLLNALYSWIVDSACTPHILVNAEMNGVQVPAQFVKDGQIILNISPSAVQGFHMDAEGVSFSARFGGTPHHIFAPIAAILGIYARENGQGMVFEDEYDEDGGDSPTTPPSSPPPSGGRPSLKVVK